MSGQKLTHIGKNAVEDGVEDFFQALIYRRMQKFTKPFLEDFQGDSEFDEAMQSFIQTLSSGLALYAFTKVMSFFFDRGVKLSTAFWTYIVSGKVKKKIDEALKNSKFKGKKAFKVLSLAMGADRTSDRIEITKLMQSNIDSFDKHKFHYQNQFQKEESKLDRFALTGATLKGSLDNESMEMVLFNTKNALWKNTAQHKRLFEKATGSTISQFGEGSWTQMHKELNKLTDLYITLDGEATNLATILSKILAKSGATR